MEKKDENEPMDWWDWLTVGLLFPPFMFIFLEMWLWMAITMVLFLASIFLNNYMEKKKEEQQNLKSEDA